MIKKIIFFFGIALTLQFISGCVDCNCGPAQTYFTTTKTLLVTNIDSTLPEPMISNSSVIAANHYGFKIQLLSDRVARNSQKINWSFIQTAYACSCPEDIFKSKERILLLEIFSNNDFDVGHSKNTNLSSYFKVKVYNNFYTIAEYVQYINKNYQTSSNPFYWGPFLQVAPTLNKKHKFRLKLTLSDGRILEAETTEVELM